MKRLNAGGHSLVEMCFAMLILALLGQMAAMGLLVVNRKTLDHRDHSYAALKAQQMFNELQATANSSPGSGGEALDRLNDGAQYQLVLTTDPQVTSPDDPVSGNLKTNGHWRYLRQVQVSPAPDLGPWSRQVVIRVWRCASDGAPPLPGLLLSTALGPVIPGNPPSYSQDPPLYPMPIN
jgi:hypothetical protein